MLLSASAGVCLVERNVAQRIVALHEDIVEARVAHGVPGDDVVSALGPDTVLAVARGACIAGKGVGALQEDLIALGLIEVVDCIRLVGSSKDIATVGLFEEEIVGAGPTIQLVRARAAVQVIRTIFTVERIVAGVAKELVIPVEA